MLILNWNISYGCKIEKIFNEITNIIKSQKTFIITLQEVTQKSFEFLKNKLQEKSYIYYSLNYRQPGKYDTNSRKLGVAIIISKNFEVLDANVFSRCLLPERTLFTTIKHKNKTFKIATFHSITGCAHKKAKSIQFYSFAETVENYQPDILTIDANEPEIDHFDISEMKFFNNLDKGKGAETFFRSCINNNLTDCFAKNFNPKNFLEGNPLTTSHIINNNRKCSVRKNKRYDFVFLNLNKINFKNIEYNLENAFKATSDHAYITLKAKI